MYEHGYTAGVYDLFHIGHLNLLKRAKERCRYLTVAVSTDELVAYKNTVPVIPFQERLEIVRSIRYVDEVVVQSDINKVAAWHQYKYDVLFVGDDWKGTPSWIEYERALNALGAKVEYIPYTKSTSSTKLRKVLDALIPAAT